MHPDGIYKVYLGASSQNPGRSACAVLVVRGAQRAAKHTTIAHATYDEALWGALLLGLVLLAEKRGAAVEFVVPSLTLLEAARPPRGREPKLVADGKEALDVFNRARAPALRATVRLARPDERPTLQQAHRLAYDAACAPPAVGAGPATSTTGGGARSTP